MDKAKGREAGLLTLLYGYGPPHPTSWSSLRRLLIPCALAENSDIQTSAVFPSSSISLHLACFHDLRAPWGRDCGMHPTVPL